jgi:hypothetical protein
MTDIKITETLTYGRGSAERCPNDCLHLAHSARMALGKAEADCPCCKGSGMVPSASGMSDVPCLCATLDASDRVILRGRADRLRAMKARTIFHSAEDRAFHTEQIASKVQTMVHLVAGCVGPCRGNSATEPRCVL